MDQFEAQPEGQREPANKEIREAGMEAKGGDLEEALPSFRQMVQSVFYGKELFKGDVPNIFGLESGILPPGALRDQFDQRHPERLNNILGHIGGNLQIEFGQPFFDDGGLPTRLSEATFVSPEGKRSWVIPDQLAFSDNVPEGRMPQPELLSMRCRMVQHLQEANGANFAYLTMQFDPSQPRVLDELLENAQRSQANERTESSFLLRAFRAHVDRLAKKVIEETLRFEFDDPYTDRDKVRFAHLVYSEWRQSSERPMGISATRCSASLAAGRFEGERPAAEFTAEVPLPFGRGGQMTFGAALNSSGFLVVFTQTSHPHSL